MNRIQTANYMLIASAFVLAGLLIAKLPDNSAQAGLVVSRDNVTMLTAQTNTGEDGLFVLDNTAHRLLVYSINPGRKRLEVMGIADLQSLFTQAATATGEPPRGRGR